MPSGFIEDSYQLSPLQLGMLYTTLSHPPGVDVEQTICELHEELDVPLFEAAWQRVVDRHPILRTSFRWEDVEEPVQEVHAHVKISLEFHDCRDLTSSEWDVRFKEFLQFDRDLGLKMDQAPMMRFTLFQLADSDYLLVWTAHHALLDGPAFGRVLKEVFSIYEHSCNGETLELEPVPPFRNYVDWWQQQSWSNAEAFWRESLKDFTAPTSLDFAPTSKKATDGPDYQEQEIWLSTETTAKLTAFAKEHGLTANTIVQGAWTLLLARYSNQQDIVFGVTRTCRRLPLDGIASMVGLLLNTLPFRSRVPPDQQLLSWLKDQRNHHSVLRDYEHSSLLDIQSWSEVPRGTPLFESLFAFQNSRLNPTLRALGGKWENREFWYLEQAIYPLVILGYLGPELLLRIAYYRSRFDDETIARMLCHFRVLLEAMVADPHRKLKDLPFLTAEEEQQQLQSWNETKVEIPEVCVHELIEQQVRARPQAVAVVCGQQTLSYEELNKRAHGLAARLQEHGVGPEVVVGVYTEGLAAVVSMLAVLKAGGAYLVLDHEYPAERLSYLLEDAQVGVVIGEPEIVAQLPDYRGVVISPTEVSDSSVKNEVSNGNIAYVIYTSGSTGRPKGVAVTHRNIMRLIWETQYARLDQQTCLLQVGSMTFDLSTFEVWGPLVHGGKLVLSEERVPTVAQVERVIREQGVETLWLTSSLYNAVVEERVEALRNVRQLLVGGEALSPRHIRKGLAVLAETEITNGYGPTEVTTFTCTHRVRDTADESWERGVPIGKPISNTSVYVLDERQELTAVGVVGELYVGGAGVARGYWQAAALTAERFIPDAYSGVAGARLYRTGDLVRWRADGALEFLGRRDDQVKVRGYRIELGEIESVLRAHASVKEAVVVAQPGGAGEKRLVGYVESEASGGELQGYLRSRLPEYMAPSVLVTLAQMPLTASGKVDRQALQELEAGPELEREYVAPRTQTEQMLSEIWAQVLGVERAGIYDNFFELGGHSLFATQVVSRVRAAFHIELSPRVLFESRTLEALSHAVDEEQQKEQRIQTPPISPRAENVDLPLSFAQQRLWFVDQLEGSSSFYNVPLALSLENAVDALVLERALTEIVRRHESLRTVFAKEDGQARQVICAPQDFKLSTIDLRRMPHEDRETSARQLMQEVIAQPFDLAHGPLLRAVLFQLDEQRQWLLVVMHHIVTDGWSTSLFLRELTSLYEAFSKGEASPLDELPIQYADFALWQRAWLKGDVLARQLDYWGKQLGDGAPALELPADFTRPARESHRGGREVFVIEPHIVERLKALCREEDATLFMVLLAAWQLLLARYSGQKDFVVGVDMANRNRAETESLIGFFINMLPIRGNLSGNPSFRQLLRRTKELCLGAYAHQDVPFELLVEEFAADRDLSRNPIFQVAFVLQNTPVTELELGGVRMKPVEVETGYTPFDLVLSLSELDQELVGWMLYSSDLFEQQTIGRLCRHYNVLLEAVVREPEQPVWRMPLVSAVEQQQLAAWNETRVELPGLCVHELIEEQARRRPQAVAVVCGAEAVSYGELNERANRLAARLQEQGVGPEIVVGVYTEGLAAVVSMLAVLKAGGAYLVLDHEYPAERLSYLLEDAQVGVVIGEPEIVAQLPGYWGVVISPAEGTDGDVARTVNQENLAYVIYTSGSTGEPKGVAVTHRNIVRLVSGANYVRLSEATCVLQLGSLSFDASTFEIWGPLVHGGKLVLSEERVPTVAQMERVIGEQGVETLWLTSSLYNAVVEERVEALRNVRQLLVGGEALSPRHIRKGLAVLAETEITNGYGPTEVTTFTCTHRVRDTADESWERGVPIGKPISNTSVYVLDERQELTAVGVVGELYVGGAGVARGYWQAAALTAERFIPDAYSGVAGARLYRTGDLVRWRADGALEFLGRRDDQVKVRGYRIELGEIESVLRAHASVKEAVVIAQPGGAGEKRLVGYVVSEASGGELQGYLRSRLPEYMAPSVIVTLAQMPLTTHGKVDRQALQELEAGPELEREYVAPRTQTEQMLSEIWAQVLGVERAGIYDNFFELGGDSIFSIQVVAKAEDRGLPLSIHQLFQSPTIEALAQSLSPEAHGVSLKSEAFSLLSSEDKQRIPEGLDDAYPLALLQTGMIYHSEYSPETPVYHDIFSYHLHAPLDLERLRDCLNELVARHQVLRTSFDLNSFSEPLQLVQRQVELPLEISDISNLDEAEQHDVVLAAIESEKRRGFDWTTAPLVRFMVHRRGDNSFQFTFSFHHALFDGWSLAVLITELFQHYWYLLGRSGTGIAPAPAVSYREFIALEREAIHSAESRRYWDRKLDHASPTALSSRPGRHSEAPRSVHEVKIPERTVVGLQSLRQRTGAPLKSIMLAAHLRVLGLLSGRSDVVTGFVTNGRPEKTGGDRVVGLFLNTLPFRHRLANGTWEQLVRDVFETEQEMLPHRRYPLAQLQREHGGRLFEAVFNFTHYKVLKGMVELDGLEILDERSVTETNFPFLVNCNVDPVSADLRIQLFYDGSAFGEHEISTISKCFSRVLEAMAEDPQAQHESTSLLDAAEREQLEDWNRTARLFPRGSSIAEQFELQVMQRGDAEAVVYGTERLSYRELNERANRLAHYLKEQGVGPEVVVGIRQERSVDLIVSLLGVLKAGGAYLPLDPEYPESRHEYMAAQAGAKLVLSELPQWLNEYNTENVERQSGGDNLAYVMYTSGSTGRPKGIAVTQANVLRLVHEPQYVRLDQETVMLQLASNAFDAATFEIWGALLHGARLVLFPGRLASGAELRQLIAAEGVETLWLTSALYNGLVESGVSALAGVKQLLVGGEALSVKHIQQGLAALPETEFINGFGPTEVTTFSCTHRVRQTAAESWDRGVPIGRPINNTEAYVLDERGQLLPVGVTGELYLGGEGLARGYVGDAAQTAEKFVPHAFAKRAGERLYRTGDLVRWRADGELEFVGRVDEQVKLRGYRIEPGEIEQAVKEHEAVQDAVVVVRGGEDEEKRLVAYVVAQASVNELRAHLRERLPEYMAPWSFEYLERLPLNANGKVDRDALPEPASVVSSSEEYVGPRTATEEVLCGIWSEVLRVDRIGVNDNFFALGGHSLSAVQAVSRAREALQTTISLRSIFDRPTTSSFAAAIAENSANPSAIEKMAQLMLTVARLSDEDVETGLRDLRDDKSHSAIS